MDKIVQKLVAMGIPGLVLLAVASTTGLAGGAALITALAVMGGPFGIAGGVIAIATLALAVDAVAEYGFEKIAKAVVKGLKNEGHSRNDIIVKIRGYKILSSSLKEKILKIV